MNQENNVEEIVVNLIAETLGVDRELIGLDKKIEDLCADSIQIFNLILAFEKKFDYQSRYEDLIDIETVGDIIQYIEKTRQANK